MKNRWALIASILLGSYFVHCTQSMVTSMSGGRHDGGGGTKDSAGAIGDAHAETGGGTCCTAPDREAPTVLFDDLVEPVPVAGSTNTCTWNSPVIDISGYRSVVVHSPKCDYRIQVRNGKAGFVNALLATCDGNQPEALGRVSTIDSTMGRELRVNFGESNYASAPDGSASCSATPVAITIVGHKHP